MSEKVHVPDVGEAEDVEVVEVLVALGDTIDIDDSLVVLESDKASMEVPSPVAGKVASIAVTEGDKVKEGSLLLEIESAEAEAEDSAPGDDDTATPDDAAAQPDETGQDDEFDGSAEEPDQADPEGQSDGQDSPQKIETSRVIPVPDVGDAAEVTVVEVLVQRGDHVEDGASLVVLESDKASLEIPTDLTGVVQEIMVHEGDEVVEGDPLVTIVGRVEASDAGEQTDAAPAKEVKEAKEEKPASREQADSVDADAPRKPAARQQSYEDRDTAPSGKVHAGPAVRKQAREYGVDLADVESSGRKGRILKEDIQAYVKKRLSSGGESTGGAGIPKVPEQDFSKYGETENKPLSRVRRASARNLHRSWLNIPHVTQFDEADITDLEAFRKLKNEELARDGVKLTPLAFLVKACVDALTRYPQFNSSISGDYEHLVLKMYYHIGIAVETDDGLVVPVLKDADAKGLIQIAGETAALAAQARDKKLPMDAMQGASFTISSLGGIGGTRFTPIVNAPEVAILGVSRSRVAPVWNGDSFEPRTMLPLSLSYDHRAIDGAEAARFTNYLAKVLGDMRHLLL